MKLVVVTVVALVLAPVAAVAQEPPATRSEVTRSSTVAQRSAARLRAFRVACEARDARLRDLTLAGEMTDLALERLRPRPPTVEYARRQTKRAPVE